MSKLGKNLYRQSILRKGYVNATIIKPRTYFVIENSSPGTPVFNQTGNWLGVSVYKMERGQPSSSSNPPRIGHLGNRRPSSLTSKITFKLRKFLIYS